MSSMTGCDQLDFFGMWFSFLISVQNLLVPSFLSVNHYREVPGLSGWMHNIFAANISFTALSTIGCLAKGVLYGLNLTGGWSSVSIHILIVLVLPK